MNSILADSPTASPALTETTMATEQADAAARMERERHEFTDELVDRGLMSREFAESGALDAFGIMPEQNLDAITHILVGDGGGGAHHLGTIVDLEIPGRTIASEIYSPDRIDSKTGETMAAEKQLTKNRTRQRVSSRGDFRVKTVEITDGDTVKVKVGESSMFPTEWSSQQVLEAALAVSQTEPVRRDEERHTLIHIGSANGLKIKVITQEKTGKILLAWPENHR